jgi:TIR domain
VSPDGATSGTAAGQSGRSGLRIFLNYRREDAADAAGRIFDALATHFGDGHVFMDIDTIEPGVDFEAVVNEAVGTCDVLLAVIGRQWLTVTDRRGRRRLEKPDDYVRMELQAALARDVRVIPVLVQGVEMPGSDELPDALQTLARRNALEVSPTRWRYDISRLTTALERIADTASGQPVGAETAEPAAREPVEEDGEHVQASPRAAPPAPPDRNRRDPRSGRSRNLMPLILLGIIAVVGIAVGVIVASGGSSHSGTTTITTKHTTTNHRTRTTTASLPKNCGPGIRATEFVSCGLANNVFYEYFRSGNGTLKAWSHGTQQYYKVSCSTAGAIVKCAVSGTTDPHAEVDLTETSLSLYTPAQANSYAAKADIGPNG